LETLDSAASCATADSSTSRVGHMLEQSTKSKGQMTKGGHSEGKSDFGVGH
jgi:hypothetical protein